jgi:predicted ATPase
MGKASFVGREQELAELGEWFASSETRLVTLLGSAGVGKSRLAREFAQQKRDRFPGGVIQCDFAGATSIEDVARIVARALDIDAKANIDVVLEQALASRARCLLVVDDCGHLPADELDATLGRWLSAAPRLFILATSWRRLKLLHERPFVVKPLDAAHDERLFIDRARAVTARELDPQHVRSLLALLEGIPLAIELAATAMGVFTPSQLMDRRELLLDMTAEDEIWASRPLRQALSLAFDPLSEIEKRVFAACSVFQGRFAFDAVQALLPAEPAVRVLKSLQVLADHSLLRPDEGGEHVHFRMFESVRHFAREQLSLRGELTATRQRYTAHFGEVARAQCIAIEGEGRVPASRWLWENEENLLAVVRGAEGEVDDPTPILWAVAGLRWVGVGRGPLSPYARLCREALDRFPVPGEARGYLLLGAANIHRHMGDLESASRFSEGAFTASRTMGDRRLEVRALFECARLADKVGQAMDAAKWLEEAGELARATSDTWAELAIFFARPRPEVDAIGLERICTLAAKTRDPVMMVRAEAAMATRLAAEGRNVEALTRAENMRTISDQLGERTWRMHADRLAAMALADSGQLAEARRVLQGALEQSRAIGYLQSEGEALGYLGLVEFEQGQLDAAADHLRAAAGKLHPREPAYAIFCAAHDAVDAEREPARPPRAASEVVEAVLDEGQRAAVAGFDALARLTRARGEPSAVEPPPEPSLPGIEARIALRLFRRALVRLRPPETALVVARDASWFRAPGAAKADLSTRPLLRSLLLLLLRAHGDREGELVSREQIAAAVWPDQKLLAKASANRLAVAVSTLRKAGLADVLASDPRGIGLRAGIHVVLVDP